jgi:DNA-binding transcriptional ArsR family regulator
MKPCLLPSDSRRDLRPVEGPEADAELAALARALGHPARVQIVRLLARRPMCICGEIVDEVGLAQSTVSQHLKALKAAGVVQGEVDGPRRCYGLDQRVLRRLKALVGGI